MWAAGLWTERHSSDGPKELEDGGMEMAGQAGTPLGNRTEDFSSQASDPLCIHPKHQFSPRSDYPQRPNGKFCEHEVEIELWSLKTG